MSKKTAHVRNYHKWTKNISVVNAKYLTPLKCLNIPAILSLARIHAYMPICFFSTAVGLDMTNTPERLKFLLTIGLANTFALVATFIFNNIVDVSDDLRALSPKNTIALGKVSKETGYLAAAMACALSIYLAVITSFTVFVIILSINIIGFLYSWKPVRLKTMPFWDVFSNAVIGGLMFLSSAWSSDILFEYHLWLICLLFFLGTGASLIVHQLFDYQNDIAAHIKTTVVTLGKRKSCWVIGSIFFLMACLLANECRSGVFSLTLILSFCIFAICLILFRIILFPKQTAHISGRIVPWAINLGAGIAIFIWFVTGD